MTTLPNDVARCDGSGCDIGASEHGRHSGDCVMAIAEDFRAALSGGSGEAKP